MSFNEVSKSIWLQMAGIPPNTDPYEADFYGSTTYEGIDLPALMQFIKNQKKDNSLLFKRSGYAKGFTRVNLGWVFGWSSVPVPNNVVFTYTDALGQNVKAKISGLMNKREDTLDPSWAFNITVSGREKECHASMQIHYSNTEDFRELAKDTQDNLTDFRIPDKYTAIKLSAENLTDFCYLIGELYGTKQKTDMEQRVAQAFASALMATKEGSELKFVYEHIPDFAYALIAPLIDYKLLEDHLDILKSYDDTGFFSWLRDSSGAVVSLFRLMCSGNSAKLFATLKSKPVLLKELYHNLDGESTLNGVTDKNYILFANLVDAVCAVNMYDGLKRTGDTYYVGPGYELDSNLFISSDKYPDKIFLQQIKTKYIDQPTTTEMDDFGVTVVTGGSYTQRTPVGEGDYYHPMDLVLLVDVSTKEQVSYLVPAIFVKAISDKEEWQAVKTAIRIGLDVLAIVIGIASLGTASPLFFALAVADIALSAADIVVAVMEDTLMQTPEGREFLAAWDKIMLVGGIVTAGPLLLRSTFTLGVKLFSKATLATTKNFLRASVMKIMLEINIANFTRNSVHIFDTVQEVVLASKNLFRTKDLLNLQKAGVVFLQGETLVNGRSKQIFAFIYNGEVIASGEANVIKATLKKIWSYGGPRLIKELDLLAKRCERIREIMADAKFVQVRGGKSVPYAIHEVESFVDLEREFAMTARASKPAEAGDIVAQGGTLNGQSLDPLGVYNDAATIARWQQEPEKMLGAFKRSIDRHFEKIANPKNGLPALDKVVIDFRYMEFVHPKLRKIVLTHIGSSSYPYKQYVTKQFLIKLNQ